MTTNTNSSEYVTPTVRLAVDDLAPKINKALNTLERASREISLEKPLQEIVRLRASQINGCVYCVDLHARDAVAGGDAERRINLVSSWREAPFFTARERAALALTEAVTRLADSEVGDDVWDEAKAHFSEVELAELLWTITVINAWNRLGAVARPWALGGDAKG